MLLHFDEELPDEWPTLFAGVMGDVHCILGHACACDVVTTHTHRQEGALRDSARRALSGVRQYFDHDPEPGDYCAVGVVDQRAGVTSIRPVLFLQYDIICPAHRRSVIAHEYMHVHQNSMMGLGNGAAEDLGFHDRLAPMWLMEGCAALFEHLYIREYWAGLGQDGLKQAVRAVHFPKEFGLPVEPGAKSFGAEQEEWPGSVNYYLETLAVCFLCEVSDLWQRLHVLFTEFFSELGTCKANSTLVDWRSVFADTFGLDVATFYEQFNYFLRLPLTKQVAILPQGKVLHSCSIPGSAWQTREAEASCSSSSSALNVLVNMGICGPDVIVRLTVGRTQNVPHTAC